VFEACVDQLCGSVQLYQKFPSQMPFDTLKAVLKCDRVWVKEVHLLRAVLDWLGLREPDAQVCLFFFFKSACAFCLETVC